MITASRTTKHDPFAPGAEHRLGDFAALVAQAIANSEARREVAELAEEQAALRRVATLVAGGADVSLGSGLRGWPIVSKRSTAASVS